MTKDALDDFPSKQEILKTISDAVYSQYPKKEWQGLSFSEVRALWDKCLSEGWLPVHMFFYTELEKMLKEKNNA